MSVANTGYGFFSADTLPQESATGRGNISGTSLSLIFLSSVLDKTHNYLLSVTLLTTLPAFTTAYQIGVYSTTEGSNISLISQMTPLYIPSSPELENSYSFSMILTPTIDFNGIESRPQYSIVASQTNSTNVSAPYILNWLLIDLGSYKVGI